MQISCSSSFELWGPIWRLVVLLKCPRIATLRVFVTPISSTLPCWMSSFTSKPSPSRTAVSALCHRTLMFQLCARSCAAMSHTDVPSSACALCAQCLWHETNKKHCVQRASGRHDWAQRGAQRARKKRPRRRQQPLLRWNPRRQSRRRARTVVRLHAESNAQSGRLASNKQNHVVDSPDLEAGKDDCQAPRRPLDHSNWNPAISTKQKGYRKQGRPATSWEGVLNTYLQPDRMNSDSNDFTSDITWLTAAEDS